MYQFERNMRFSSTYLNTFSKGKEQEKPISSGRQSSKKNKNFQINKEPSTIFSMTRSQMEDNSQKSDGMDSGRHRHKSQMKKKPSNLNFSDIFDQ